MTSYQSRQHYVDRWYKDEQITKAIDAAFDDLYPDPLPAEWDDALRAVFTLGALSMQKILHQLGGKMKKHNTRPAAQTEAQEFEAFRRRRPGLSRMACAKLFPVAPGRQGGRALLRRVARATK